MAVYSGDTLIAEKNPDQVSAAEITAGTETGLRSFSPKNAADIVAAHGGGGIGGLEFFGRTSNLTLGSSYANALSGNFTPPATDTVVGMLVSVGTVAGTAANRTDFQLRRGTTDLTAEIRGARVLGFSRQLFLDKPASTSQQSYALRAKGTGTGQTLHAGSSLTVFAMPDGVAADVITSDESLTQDTDFLSVSITPSSTSAKIKLNLLVLSNATDWDLALRRGTTELVEVAQFPQTDPDPTTFPSNFEDWVDEPNTTNAVTYTVRPTTAVTARSAFVGSYLMAQEV